VQPGGPLADFRGSSSARVGTGTVPTRSTGSITGLPVPGSTPFDWLALESVFSAAGFSAEELLFSSVRAGFSSGVEGWASIAAGLSSPGDCLVGGTAASARAFSRSSTRAASAPTCSASSFRSLCCSDSAAAIACIASSCDAGADAGFDGTAATTDASSRCPTHISVAAIAAKAMSSSHGNNRRDLVVCA